MPLLKPEQDIWPLNLLDEPESNSDESESDESESDESESEESESEESTRTEFSDSVRTEEPAMNGVSVIDGVSVLEVDSARSLERARSTTEAILAHEGTWWALYTLARFEKKLMRQLIEIEVPFYGPTIARRYRSPQGRVRTSVEPLFPNYVFIMGDEMARYKAVSTGSVSRWLAVANPAELVTDLRQIRSLILTDAPLSPELRLQPGQKVRVKTGVFKGFEGVIIRRENEVRLLISVRYMGRGASVKLDDCQVEAI
jgi:transcription antitermination factor NusG